MKGMTATGDNTGAVFFLVVAAVWFGTSNAAREIVSERAIYMRERMVNLGLLNYVASKYILLAFFCIIQCTVLLAIVFFTLGFQGGPSLIPTQGEASFSWDAGYPNGRKCVKKKTPMTARASTPLTATFWIAGFLRSNLSMVAPSSPVRSG